MMPNQSQIPLIESQVNTESPVEDAPQNISKSAQIQPILQLCDTLEHLASNDGVKNIKQMASEIEDLRSKEIHLTDWFHRSLYTKYEEIADLARAHDTVQQQVNQMLDEEHKTKRQITELQRLQQVSQQSIEDKDSDLQKLIVENQKLQEGAKKQANREKALKGELDIAQRFKEEARDLRSQLQNTKQELEEASKYSASLSNYDLEQILEQLTQTWEPLISLTSRYFQDNLSRDVLLDKEIWESSTEDLGIPLYPSNSEAAKYFRTAWALSIMSRQIYSKLLLPCYAFESTGDIRRLLVNLAITDSPMESRLRAMLLAISEEQHLITKDERIRRIVKNVVHSTQEFVQRGKSDEFRSELTDCLDNLYTSWRRVQYLNIKIDIGFSSDYPAFDLKSLRLHSQDTPKLTQAPDVKAEDVGVEVLPGIFSVDGKSGPAVIVKGACIRRAQLDRGRSEQRAIARNPPQRLGTVTRKDGRHRASASDHESSFLSCGAAAAVRS